MPALTEGCYLGVGFPEDDSRDGATECGPAAIFRDDAVECGPAAVRQILCACGAVNLTVSLREQPERVYTVKLSQGDYALLEENVCYKVLREPGTAGYFYILSPVGCV